MRHLSHTIGTCPDNSCETQAVRFWKYHADKVANNEVIITKL